MKEENNKQKQAKLEEQEFMNKFNSITEKDKLENQNQQHNVRKEGINPINQKR